MIFAVLIVTFAVVSIFFLVRPVLWRAGIVSEVFDEVAYRKQLLKDQLEELEENMVEEETSSELKDELGLIFLSERERQAENSPQKKADNRMILSIFSGVAFLMVLFGVCSYWIVGGHDLLEIEGAEELLALDSAQEALSLEKWEKRLTKRVQEDNEDGKSWYLLGHAHLKVGAYGKASDAFSQADRFIRGDLNVLSYWLQARYLESGKVDSKSQGIIQEVLELDPSHVAVREILGVDALKNREMLTAIAELNKAISASTSSMRQTVLAALVTQARSTLPAEIGGVFVVVKGERGIPDESTIFVIARPVGGGIPYAVVKRPALMLPFSVVLDDLVGMQSTRLLSLAESFEIVVRVSQTGTINRGANETTWISRPLSNADYGQRTRIEVEMNGLIKQTD